MDTIDEMLACFKSWEPAVRVLGNIRAQDAIEAIETLRAELAECRDALAKIGPYYVPSIELSDDEVNAMYAMIDAARKGEGEK